MSVLGHVELAEDALDHRPEAARHLNRARATIQRATDLTRQMLAYSGQGQAALKPVDLSQLVNEMSSLFEVSINKKARLSLSIDSAAAGAVGDATQLRQVVMNLITNASEALEEKPGENSRTHGRS